MTQYKILKMAMREALRMVDLTEKELKELPNNPVRMSRFIRAHKELKEIRDMLIELEENEEIV